MNVTHGDAERVTKAAKTGGMALLLALASLDARPSAAQTAVAPPEAAPADDGHWRYAFTPYLWTKLQGGEASFQDILPQPRGFRPR